MATTYRTPVYGLTKYLKKCYYMKVKQIPELVLNSMSRLRTQTKNVLLTYFINGIVEHASLLNYTRRISHLIGLMIKPKLNKTVTFNLNLLVNFCSFINLFRSFFTHLCSISLFCLNILIDFYCDSFLFL